MGVRLRGDAARVLVDGRQIGNLYRWHVEGGDGGWWATANKYRLAEGVDGDAQFCFFLGPLAIEGMGRFVTDVTADGSVHRDSVEVEGTLIWVHQPDESS